MPHNGLRYAERSRGRLSKIAKAKVGAKPVPKSELIEPTVTSTDASTNTGTESVTLTEGDSTGQEEKKETESQEETKVNT